MAHGDVTVICVRCGRQLQGDRDDDPNADEGPTCGDCARLDDFVLIDLLDGELDGHLE